MQGSTSPSKKGESPNSGPQVVPRTRSIARRARALVGSSPKLERSPSVKLEHVQALGTNAPPPQEPSGP